MCRDRGNKQATAALAAQVAEVESKLVDADRPRVFDALIGLAGVAAKFGDLSLDRRGISAWGVDALSSMQFTPGTFVLLDASLYGRVVVRENLFTRIGFAGTDFTDNIIWFVAEEKLTQTIGRPQAICVISHLNVVT